MTAELALFDLAEVALEWTPILSGPLGPITTARLRAMEHPCRDCGRDTWHGAPYTLGAGGCAGGLSWAICDDCAALDRVGEHPGYPADMSYHGIRTTPEQRAALELARERHRAAYRQRAAA